jgi:endonuclease/exonuclease/phosphatase family metal-dependent hydrolase
VEPPVVLMGDLNQRAAGLGPLRDAGFRGPRRVWTRSIDHILAGRGLRLGSLRTFRTTASDHPALAAEVMPEA